MAATRPLLSCLGDQALEMMARRFSDTSISSCGRRSSGKKLTIRSSAWLALFGVQRGQYIDDRFQRTQSRAPWFPRSQISPIKITSGAWRSRVL